MCRVPRRKLLRRGSNKGDRCVCDGPLLGDGIVSVHELRSGAVSDCNRILVVRRMRRRPTIECDGGLGVDSLHELRSGPVFWGLVGGVHELRSGAVPGERRGVELHDLRSRDVPAKLRRVGLRLLYCGLRIDGDWGVGFGSLFGRHLQPWPVLGRGEQRLLGVRGGDDASCFRLSVMRSLFDGKLLRDGGPLGGLGRMCGRPVLGRRSERLHELRDGPVPG